MVPASCFSIRGANNRNCPNRGKEEQAALVVHVRVDVEFLQQLHLQQLQLLQLQTSVAFSANDNADVTAFRLVEVLLVIWGLERGSSTWGLLI